MVKRRVAIIPARSGSERIPKKNIIDFLGKPMIVHTIQAALSSEKINDVIVSTDSEEIAEIAQSFGASVPFLRDEYHDSQSSVSDAVHYTLKKLEKDWNKKWDDVLMLMPNCPLRDCMDINRAITHFEKSESKFQLSCFKYGWQNPWWAHTIEDSGRAQPIFDLDKMKTRSQDLAELFCPSGAIWIANCDEFSKIRTFYGPGYTFFPLSWQHAVDIDDEADLQMAVFLAKFSH